MGNIIEVKTDIKVVCPFRTKTIMSQSMSGSAEQLVVYPECQYGQCPMYNEKGATVGEKCLQAQAVLCGMKNGGVI